MWTATPAIDLAVVALLYFITNNVCIDGHNLCMRTEKEPLAGKFTLKLEVGAICDLLE